MKRRANVQLRRDDLDKIDSEQEEEEEPQKGTFGLASSDEISKRVIKSAKRRINRISDNSGNNNDDPKPAVFSNFSWATNSTKCNSFSFLSKCKPENSVEDKKDNPFSFLSKALVPSSSTTDVSTASTTSNKTIEEKRLVIKKDAPTSLTTSEQNGDKKTYSPDDVFYYKLKCLNIKFAEWVLTHINENKHYILTPIFDDYERYIEQIVQERKDSLSNSKEKEQGNTHEGEISESHDSQSKSESSKPITSENVKQSDLPIQFSKPQKHEFPVQLNSDDNKGVTTDASLFRFEPAQSYSPSKDAQSSGFKSFTSSFNNQGNKMFSIMPPTKTEGFKFFDSGKSDESSKSTTAPTFGSTSSNVFAPGYFSFSPAKKEEPVENKDEEEEEQPIVESKPVTEDGALYEKRCKVFFKKDNTFAVCGVGVLFLKIVDVNGAKKSQVIVRADNSLGNILMNVLLNESIPVKKVGKNNVMVICCPTPEAKLETILLKVKLEDDANELFDKLEKYKKNAEN